MAKATKANATKANASATTNNTALPITGKNPCGFVYASKGQVTYRHKFLTLLSMHTATGKGLSMGTARNHAFNTKAQNFYNTIKPLMASGAVVNKAGKYHFAPVMQAKMVAFNKSVNFTL